MKQEYLYITVIFKKYIFAIRYYLFAYLPSFFSDFHGSHACLIFQHPIQSIAYYYEKNMNGINSSMLSVENQYTASTNAVNNYLDAWEKWHLNLVQRFFVPSSLYIIEKIELPQNILFACVNFLKRMNSTSDVIKTRGESSSTSILYKIVNHKFYCTKISIQN